MGRAKKLTTKPKPKPIGSFAGFGTKKPIGSIASSARGKGACACVGADNLSNES